MEDRIILSDLRLWGRHGVDAREQAVAQEFAVEIECPTDARRAAQRDDLAAAFDYRRLVEVAGRVIGGTPRQLVETLAEEIAEAALATLKVAWVRVRVTKVRPGSIPGRASVELTRPKGLRATRRHPPVELHVPDFALVKQFYGHLGFRVTRQEPGPSGYLVLALERNVLAFWPGDRSVAAHSFFGRFPADAPRGLGIEIILEVDDVEALYAEARRFAQVLAPLQQRSWGARDFRIEDPFGYYLRITDWSRDPPSRSETLRSSPSTQCRRLKASGSAPGRSNWSS